MTMMAPSGFGGGGGGGWGIPSPWVPWSFHQGGWVNLPYDAAQAGQAGQAGAWGGQTIGPVPGPSWWLDGGWCNSPWGSTVWGNPYCPQIWVGGACCSECAETGGACNGAKATAIRVGISADELKGRFAHMTAAVKAHDGIVQAAFQQRKVDLALNKGVQPGTIGADYVQPWNEWVQGYFTFAAANVPSFWTDDEAIEAQLKGYEQELVQWISKFKTESGKTDVPVFEPPPEPEPDPDGIFGGGLGKTAEGLSSLLTTVAWITAAGVGAYLLFPLLPVVQKAIAGVVK